MNLQIQAETERKKQHRVLKSQKTIKKIALGSPYIVRITVYANGWNSPIKRHTVAKWINNKNKTKLYASCKRLISALSVQIGSK